ncbi:MAG TPA: hypothetical protein ENI81_04095 [Phycisphaerales bacterium]|nr:hypothetical protein [Phycisphaerales bacterium]
MTDRMTDKEKILRHLQKYGSATGGELAYLFTHRFSARIKELREEGWIIETVPLDHFSPDGKKRKIANYVLKGGKVGVWKDRSGSGRDFKQQIVGKKPQWIREDGE